MEARRFWRDILKEFTLGPAELRILEDAVREIDLIEKMEAELEGADLVVYGSRGQPVSNEPDCVLSLPQGPLPSPEERTQIPLRFSWEKHEVRPAS